MSAPPSAPTIDLRSDTVTRPSPGMRRAMAEAEVGDDVLDGDPTTRRLEERIAELLGTGDALFFPSGTQANQTGIALVTEPGTELLLEANAHLVHSEVAGVAALSGVQIRPITTPDGLLTADLVRGALRPPSPHVPRITALAIENTHNNAGGRVLDAAGVDGLTRAARDARLAVHLDGARLWNAAAAAGVPWGPASDSRGSGAPAPGRSANAWGAGCVSRASSPRRECTRSITTCPGSVMITRMRSTSPRSCPTVRPSDRPTQRRTS